MSVAARLGKTLRSPLSCASVSGFPLDRTLEWNQNTHKERLGIVERGVENLSAERGYLFEMCDESRSWRPFWNVLQYGEDVDEKLAGLSRFSKHGDDVV
jgi:hypothetical protein